jgi:hypothetical protein
MVKVKKEQSERNLATYHVHASKARGDKKEFGYSVYKKGSEPLNQKVNKFKKLRCCDSLKQASVFALVRSLQIGLQDRKSGESLCICSSCK